MSHSRFLEALIAALGLALLIPLAPAGAEVNGAPLDFMATALDGSPVSGEELAGNTVLLDFWGTWCPPCIAAFPKLERLQAEFGENLRVVGLAFRSGGPDDVAAFLERHEVSNYTSWVAEDGLIEKFDILAFPSYVLVSAAGEVEFVQLGEYPDIYERVRKHLASSTDADGSR